MKTKTPTTIVSEKPPIVSQDQPAITPGPEMLGNPRCACWGTAQNPPMVSGTCAACGRDALPAPEGVGVEPNKSEPAEGTPPTDRAGTKEKQPCYCEKPGAVVDISSTGGCSRCGRIPPPEPQKRRTDTIMGSTPFTAIDPAKDWTGKYNAFTVLRKKGGLYVVRRLEIEKGRVLSIEENVEDLFGSQMGKIIFEMEGLL